MCPVPSGFEKQSFFSIFRWMVSLESMFIYSAVARRVRSSRIVAEAQKSFAPHTKHHGRVWCAIYFVIAHQTEKSKINMCERSGVKDVRLRSKKKEGVDSDFFAKRWRLRQISNVPLRESPRGQGFFGISKMEFSW